jgi:hypothetical protein
MFDTIYIKLRGALKTGSKKRQAAQLRTCLKIFEWRDLNLGFSLLQANHTVAFFPLATLAEQFNPLEPLEDVTFHDEAAWALETFVLGHGGLDKLDAWNALKGKVARVRFCP